MLPSVSWLHALCGLFANNEGHVGIVVIFGYLEVILDFPHAAGKSTKDSHILPSSSARHHTCFVPSLPLGYFSEPNESAFRHGALLP